MVADVKDDGWPKSRTTFSFFYFPLVLHVTRYSAKVVRRYSTPHTTNNRSVGKSRQSANQFSLSLSTVVNEIHLLISF
jgi:hypothetical protein